jgi:hypothetical protein
MIFVLYLALIVVAERCGSLHLICSPCQIDLTHLIVVCCGEVFPGIPGWVACPLAELPPLTSVPASSLELKGVSMMGC